MSFGGSSDAGDTFQKFPAASSGENRQAIRIGVAAWPSIG